MTALHTASDDDVAVLLRLLGVPDDDIAVLQRDVAYRRTQPGYSSSTQLTLGGLALWAFTHGGMQYIRGQDWKHRPWQRPQAERAVG